MVPVPAAEPLGPWAGDRLGVPMHVTLLYPFAPHGRLDAALVLELGGLFGRFGAFDYRLVELRSFDDGTAYLAPEPDEPFRALTLALRERWPEYPPYGGDVNDPVPHVTIPPEHVDRGRIDALLPLEGRADEAFLLARGPERWRVAGRFRLSG